MASGARSARARHGREGFGEGPGVVPQEGTSEQGLRPGQERREALQRPGHVLDLDPVGRSQPPPDRVVEPVELRGDDLAPPQHLPARLLSRPLYSSSTIGELHEGVPGGGGDGGPRRRPGRRAPSNLAGGRPGHKRASRPEAAGAHSRILGFMSARRRMYSSRSNSSDRQSSSRGRSSRSTSAQASSSLWAISRGIRQTPCLSAWISSPGQDLDAGQLHRLAEVDQPDVGVADARVEPEELETRGP